MHRSKWCGNRAEEKPASSSPEAMAGIAPKRSRAGTSRSARRQVAVERSRIFRPLAWGSSHTEAIIATAPKAETTAVASTAPTAPLVGSPKWPPTQAQASSALSGSMARLTTITRRGRLTPSSE